MAKQFGVSDEALRALGDPAHSPFPPDQKAALALADAMTGGAGEVSDDLFAELRRHFSEVQIVEIAAVIGLFNYFNRFNNALRVDVTLADPEVLVRRIGTILGREGRSGAGSVLSELARGRRYSAAGLYRIEGTTLVRTASAGEAISAASRAVPGGAALIGGGGPRRISDVTTEPAYIAMGASSRTALIVPVAADPDASGALVAESASVGAFDDGEDAALLERVATLVAACS